MDMELTALHGALVMELYIYAIQGVGMHEELSHVHAHSALYGVDSTVHTSSCTVHSTIHMEYACTLLCVCLVALLYAPLSYIAL